MGGTARDSTASLRGCGEPTQAPGTGHVCPWTRVLLQDLWGQRAVLEAPATRQGELHDPPPRQGLLLRSEPPSLPSKPFGADAVGRHRLRCHHKALRASSSGAVPSALWSTALDLLRMEDRLLSLGIEPGFLATFLIPLSPHLHGQPWWKPRAGVPSGACGWDMKKGPPPPRFCCARLSNPVSSISSLN